MLDSNSRHRRPSSRQQTDVTVRRATPADAAALVPLCTQLGFGCTASEITVRFERQGADPTYASWIAEGGDGQVLGFASGHIIQPVEQQAPMALLLALVTDAAARGMGVGGGLSRAFDAWAQECGASRAIAHSGDHRQGSHRAYEAYGYQPLGTRYLKRWS